MVGVPIARRNLFHEPRRVALALGGVSSALLLVLLLQGIFAGAMAQVTAYIRRSPADVIVSQQGVRTMHMSSSALPQDIVASVARVPGVAWAEPIRFATVVIAAPRGRQLSYVIGYDTTTGRGGPHLVRGRSPGAGEIVLDRLGADALSVGVGERVSVFGLEWTVSGLSSGGTSIVNSTSFMASDDFARVRGNSINYILVGATSGTDASRLASAIDRRVGGVTAQTRGDFARQEARIVSDMSADVMRIMTTIGLAIALAVISLMLYSVTLARLREFGVLKALGATSSGNARVVLAQAAWLVVLSVAFAAGLSVLVGRVIAVIAPTVFTQITAGNVVRTGIAAMAVGAIGALVPLRRVARVDPASAFRRAS